MKTFTKFAVVAALTLSTAAFASAANAAVSFVSIAQDVALTFPSVSWDGSGTGQGHLYTSSGGTSVALGAPASPAVLLLFSDPLFAAYSGLATLTIDATTGLGAAVNQLGPGGVIEQVGLNGHFEFKQGSTVVFGGIFSDAWMRGTGAGGNFTPSALGVAGNTTFYSDVASIQSYLDGFDIYSFSFGLSGVSPEYAIENGHLRDFNANTVAGVFDGAVVPEPGTWALMILGFGGVGAMLRNRRREGAAFA